MNLKPFSHVEVVDNVYYKYSASPYQGDEGVVVRYGISAWNLTENTWAMLYPTVTISLEEAEHIEENWRDFLPELEWEWIKIRDMDTSYGLYYINSDSEAMGRPSALFECLYQIYPAMKYFIRKYEEAMNRSPCNMDEDEPNMAFLTDIATAIYLSEFSPLYETLLINGISNGYSGIQFRTPHPEDISPADLRFLCNWVREHPATYGEDGRIDATSPMSLEVLLQFAKGDKYAWVKDRYAEVLQGIPNKFFSYVDSLVGKKGFSPEAYEASPEEVPPEIVLEDEATAWWCYTNYITDLRKIGQNLDSYWCKPKDFTATSKTVYQAANELRKAERMQSFERYKEWDEQVITYNGITVRPYSDIEEWKYQAEVLSQCIVRSAYFAKEESKLVFLRRNGKPLATAELSEGEVVQFLADEGDEENMLPTEEMHEALKAYTDKYGFYNN